MLLGTSRATMRPVVYRLLRALVRHALQVFFRRIEVEGRELVPPEGPLLLAANHPNTLLDVLLVASRLDRKVGFVAKATLFENPLANLLFRFLGAVPIQRRQDGPGADPEANERVLAACEDAVASGDAILIFPEGVSIGAPRLQKLKTGLARIALGAEAKAPGQVVIVPAALVYDDPETFRSRARITYAPPIRVTPFKELGEVAGDEFVGVRALTEAVRQALLPEVVHIEDEAVDDEARLIDELYGGLIQAEAGGRLAATAAISNAIAALTEKDPERVQQVRAKLQAYQAALADAGVDDRAVRGSARRPSLAANLALVLGFPFALWGVLNHFVLYQLPRLVMRTLVTDKGYAATVKFMIGLMGFFATYAVQGYGVFWLAKHQGGFTSPWTPTLLYLGTLPICAMIALVWGEGLTARRRRAEGEARRRALPPERLAELQAQRSELLVLLDAAQAAYVSDHLDPAAETAAGDDPW